MTPECVLKCACQKLIRSFYEIQAIYHLSTTSVFSNRVVYCACLRFHEKSLWNLKGALGRCGIGNLL